MNSKVADPFVAPIPQNAKDYPRGLYNPLPTFRINEKSITSGYAALAETLRHELADGLRVLVVDGYQGVDWPVFQQNLADAMQKLSIAADWIDVGTCLADEKMFLPKIKPFLGGDDRLFGTQFPFGPEVFFDAEKIADHRIRAAILRSEELGKLTIFYGTGAALIELWDKCWYIDIPKDVIQENARKNKMRNLGAVAYNGFEEFYKRAYFVDWPALNRLKRRLLPQIDRLIDLQNPACPTQIAGTDFHAALQELSRSAFRVRPWYYSGPWGGKFMQGHFGVHPDKVNLSTSFEIITPENGIVLESTQNRLEFSFDCLMFQESANVLGEPAARQFGCEWPIRLDYLDTIDGGNLSTQVHPRPNYIRRNFGETFTQDESYYIINAKPDARVYIGVTDDCDPDEFYRAVQNSVENGVEIDIDKFANSEPSKPHDLFLIPNGTVHGSGRNNLVLEISATAYIFTFKIYDWMRKDLNGKLRPINIERAWKNIRFERNSRYVKENLIAKPELIAEGPGWKKYLLASQKENWWAVHRVEFDDEYEMETNDTAFAINLVAGESCQVTTANGRQMPLAWAESMIIPAAAGHFNVKNTGKTPCKLLLVFIRPTVGISEPLNNPSE
ncbi:MAG: class I mannose-6-phosphate isomerase [Candidatus Neomarinimicrobiota bacterium]